MVTDNSSKVLTVSYGTFSCTLEGFENSFDTMKTVAEYFRDLAAADRFFGAEPPKLDAEILGILEQRGKQMGINTRQSGDTSIVLSPTQSFDEELGDEITPPADQAATQVSEPALSINERLDRIKAVTHADTVPTVYTEDEHAEDKEVGNTTPQDISNIETPIEAEAQLDALEPIVDHIEFKDSTEITPVAEDTILDPEVSTTIDAKVEDGFEAEVEATDTDSVTLDTDENDPAPIIDAPATDEEAIEMVQHPVIADDVQQNNDDLAEPVIMDTEIVNADEQEIDEVATHQADEPEPAMATDLSVSDDEENDNSSANIVESEDLSEMDDFEAALTQDLMASQDEAETNFDLDTATHKDHDAEDATAEINTLEDNDVHHDASERSALRLEQPVEEERTPLRKPKVHVINVSPAPLSEQAESVSSQPENIMDEEDAEPVDQQPVAVRRPTRPVAKTRRETSEPVDTADVSRLMAETDQQMAKPESNRRRNALAHLRAAVAATIADKSLGKDDKDSTEAYRDDLAKAVRPRRPDPSDMRKSAPLRLVAEQRIDEPNEELNAFANPTAETVESQDASNTPAQNEQANTSEFSDFGEFAAHVGAYSLEAKLEAAATYLSQVRGIDQFSRPQLLRTVKLSGTEDDFSREESLQHFAHMLRTGKLARKDDGLFEVTDEIGYKVMPKAG